MTEQFPDVQGGGSLILAYQIRDKRVLVVGGGEVSYDITLSTMLILPVGRCWTYLKRSECGR